MAKRKSGALNTAKFPPPSPFRKNENIDKANIVKIEKDEFQPISYNDANRALAAGIVDLPQQDDSTEEDEGTEEDTTPDDTSPEETTPQPVLGCTDPNADNYDSSATQDDGTCT